jgi:hypothetical protein
MAEFREVGWGGTRRLARVEKWVKPKKGKMAEFLEGGYPGTG